MSSDAPSFAFQVDPEPDADLAEAGRKLFAGPCDFVKGVVSMAALPQADRAEVCFAGRSNVGKSSLINALTGRKGLARSSNTPGRTQEINYFDLGGRVWLVDLPGYGYAQAPKAKVDAWQRLLKDYLAGRATLRRAFVLIDARHGVKAVDHEIMELLDRSAVGFQCVLTKIDKPGKGELAKVVEATKAELAKHPTAFPEILTTSSEKSDGLDRLRASVAGLTDG